MLGVVYKKDVGDARESPALEVFRLLVEKGANVTYVDPWVENVSVADRIFTSAALTPETLADADCVVVTTDHTDLDRRLVARRAALIIDAHNVVPRASVSGTLVPLSGPAFEPRPEDVLLGARV